jgi:hypothetical protein
MALFYVVSKYKILRICKIPEMTEYLIFSNAALMLGFVPLYYGTGCIVISYFQNIEDPRRPF